MAIMFSYYPGQTDGATPPKQTIVQRRIIVKNADGTTKVIQQNITQPARASPAAASTAIASGSQQSQPQQQASPAPAKSEGPQKVQIIRGPDGKVSVRGLNPGQQLIQTADGKLHVLSAAPGTLQRFLKLYNKRRIIPSPTVAGDWHRLTSYILRFSLHL